MSKNDLHVHDCENCALQMNCPLPPAAEWRDANGKSHNEVSMNLLSDAFGSLETLGSLFAIYEEAGTQGEEAAKIAAIVHGEVRFQTVRQILAGLFNRDAVDALLNLEVEMLFETSVKSDPRYELIELLTKISPDHKEANEKATKDTKASMRKSAVEHLTQEAPAMMKAYNLFRTEM